MTVPHDTTDGAAADPNPALTAALAALSPEDRKAVSAAAVAALAGWLEEAAAATPAAGSPPPEIAA